MSKLWAQPIVVATYRAVVGGVILAGAAYFGSLQMGNSQRVAGVAAGVAFFGYLATRAIGEGLMDQARA